MSRSFRIVVPLVAFVGSIGAVTACYGPTEVVVDVSTDLGCGAPIRTALFKGEPFLATPETETASCTPGPGDAEIGTLVVLPSGSRDGEAAVKAVLARGGKEPTACDADPTDCIVATRSFSFVAHTSRRVPIRLAKECLGTKCPEGQTCGAGGKCISNAVSCGGADCILAGESDGGADAGHDGPSTPSDAGGICGNASSAPLVDGVPSPFGTIATSDSVFWYSIGASGTTTPTTIRRIAKRGGAPSDATTTPGRVAVVGLGSPDLLLIAYQGVDPIVRFGLTAAGDQKVALLPIGFGKQPSGGLLTATAQGIYTLAAGDPSTASTLYSDLVARAMATTKSGLYVATDKDIQYFGADAPPLPMKSSVTVMPATKAMLRSNGTLAFAAVPGTGPLDDAMYAFQGTTPVAIGGVTGHVVSFAVDAADLFVATDATIRRYSIDGSDAKRDVAAAPPGQTIPHVLIDADCFYYWTDDGAGHAALYSRGKDGK